MLERTIIEIAPKTWLISEYKLVNMYLLEGADTALLIDCGAGIGNIRETVFALTKKPLTVVITHGHYDHDGGAMLFPAVYMHRDDLAYAAKMCEEMGTEGRRAYAISRGTVRNPATSAQEIASMVIPNGPVNRLPLADNCIFNLGGRTIEVIPTPGHSKGSVVLLDRENRLLFTGDMANDCLLLNFAGSSTSVTEYNKSMRKLWARESEYDFICIGHDALDKTDKTIIQDYIHATDKLICGEAAGTPGANALHSGTGYQEGLVLIWYNPNYL